MISKPRVLKPEQKVWQYIRRNKKFVFGNLLLVSSMRQEVLKDLLETYVECQYIKRSNSGKSILNATYIVIQKLELEPSVIAHKIKRSREILQPLNKLSKLLQREDEISFKELLFKSKFSNGSLKGAIHILESFKVLELLNQKEKLKVNFQQSVFKVDHTRLKTLRDLFDDKKVDELKELIKQRKPIKEYKEIPEHLPQILEVITQNEVLKRDELRKYSKVPRAALKKWWNILKNLGVIVDSFKESPTQRVTYILSANRAKSILTQLSKGAYVQDKELRHLWMQ